MVVLVSVVVVDVLDCVGCCVGQDELECMVCNILCECDDDIFYEVLEQLCYDDLCGYVFLWEVVEEGVDIIVLCWGEKELEINVFLIFLLVCMCGGLCEEQVLVDGDVFDILCESIQKVGLESFKVCVVLVYYFYYLEEINVLSFSEVEVMNCDVFVLLIDKKILSVLVIECSMCGWLVSYFVVDDEVLELCFLLGFLFKEVIDFFYVILQEEVVVDVYFELCV